MQTTAWQGGALGPLPGFKLGPVGVVRCRNCRVKVNSGFGVLLYHSGRERQSDARTNSIGRNGGSDHLFR
jgi:hypothetical protein